MGQVVYAPANSQRYGESNMKPCNPSRSPCNFQRSNIFLDCLLVHMAYQSTSHTWLSRTYILGWSNSDVGAPKTPKDHYVWFRREMLRWEKRFSARPFWKTIVEVETHTNQRHFVKGSECTCWTSPGVYLQVSCNPRSRPIPTYESWLGSTIEILPFTTTFRSNTWWFTQRIIGDLQPQWS